MGWTHSTWDETRNTFHILFRMSLGRPIHIWEDNIKVTPSELCLERMERNVCLNHPILYDIKDNIRDCFIQHNTFIKNTVQLCRLNMPKYRTMAAYTAQFQLIPKCPPPPKVEFNAARQTPFLHYTL